MKSLVTFIILLSSHVFAGGFVVAGGKTNTAILVYEQLLTWEQRKLIYTEIQKQFDLAAAQAHVTTWVWKINAYESVTDKNGTLAMCAAFTGNIVGTPIEKTLYDIALKAGIPNAVQSVGSCSFIDSVH